MDVSLAPCLPTNPKPLLSSLCVFSLRRLRPLPIQCASASQRRSQDHNKSSPSPRLRKCDARTDVDLITHGAVSGNMKACHAPSLLFTLRRWVREVSRPLGINSSSLKEAASWLHREVQGDIPSSRLCSDFTIRIFYSSCASACSRLSRLGVWR